MAKARKIPEALHGEILRRALGGDSTRTVAAWLAEEHGITVHHGAVAEIVKNARAERRETALAIVAEKLGGADGLSADIDGIIALRAEAETVRGIALREVQAEPSARAIGAWAAAAREYRETVRLALDVAGLTKSDESSAIADAAERVTGRIASLIAAADSGEGSS